MTELPTKQTRYDEAFWRTHHESWKRSDFNQREYCAVQGISLKAFGNWRAKFMAEPQNPGRKLLYRRGGLSHTLSHSLSHPLSHTPSHVTYPSSPVLQEPVVVPPRPGHRRQFTDAERAHILAQAAKPGATLSAVARRYRIARRVLCRWRKEQETCFVEVEIIDTPGSKEALS